MTTYFYPVHYRYQGSDRCLISISDLRHDALVVENGAVPTFPNVHQMEQFASLHRVQLDHPDPHQPDLDWAAQWCENPGAPVKCGAALAAWNLFSDLAESIGARGKQFIQMDENTVPVYCELFLGSNPDIITPPGYHYMPMWTVRQLARLREVLTAGLALFGESTFSWQPSA